MAEVLYFSTPTCGPCKMFKPIVQQVQSELGISIQYVDAQANPWLAEQHQVSAVPTIVVRTGNVTLHKHTGVMSKPQLASLLSQFK